MKRSTCLAVCILALAPFATGQSQRLEQILTGSEPRGIAELRLMQRHVKQVFAHVAPATVSIGGATGVIVKGGYVLTAAHVTRSPGRRLTMELGDGRRIRGETLGLNHRTDAGLIKITSKGDFPALDLGDSKALENGEWVMVLGFPGGRRRRGKLPPLRLGRVLSRTRTWIITDCTISAGDSGGPLFDMHGKVIGINSRITTSLQANMHVPIEAFRRDWKSLVAGTVTGSRAPSRPTALLGVRSDPDAPVARIAEVTPGSGAAKAGIKPGDVVLRFDGETVGGFEDLRRLVLRRRPGAKVRILVQRGKERLELDATLGRSQ